MGPIMNNSIVRRVHPGALRQLHLSIRSADDAMPNTDCEVTELEGEEGWQRWQDSVFVRDFEDSVLSAPVPLLDDVHSSR
jgi:hypothetical protein